jgi:alpha-tubulin suppressor-like RCC1 family protein
VAGGLTVSVRIDIRGDHTCVTTDVNAAYCWGKNQTGQLGDSSTTDRLTPVPVVGGLRFTSVSAGFSHSCGVTAAGAAYCWGYNGYGELGDGNSNTVALTPVAVAGGLTFSTVAVGWDFTCGLTTAGAAYCWGRNDQGQLGNGSVTACAYSANACTTPVPVFGGWTFTALSAGTYHACGITAAGAAYCWGGNQEGQVGNGGTSIRVSAPVPVSGGLVFTSVTAGAGHSCGLTAQGTAYCWGANQYGSLGDGSTAPRGTPVAVAGGLVLRSLSAGAFTTCGLTMIGRAYCWGRNQYGAVGDGTTTDRLTPVPVH